MSKAYEGTWDVTRKMSEHSTSYSSFPGCRGDLANGLLTVSHANGRVEVLNLAYCVKATFTPFNEIEDREGS